MIDYLPTPASTPLQHATEPRMKAKKPPKSQSKPFLFINHDAKHLKPQATRSEITSHLRTAYQPWKYRMQARARRESSKSADTQIFSKHSNFKTLLIDSDTAAFSEPAPDGDLRERSLIQTKDWNVKEMLNEELASRTPSPLFFQGNSDPFSSLSLKVTPLIAELIKFEHAHLHPCIYSTKNTPSRAYGTSYLAEMHGPAANQAAVYGYLSRAAIVLSSATPDPRFAQAALVLKGKSSVLLRAQIASGEGADQGDLLRKILALMIAELFAHNYEAVLVHSKILMNMLKQKSETEEFDMRFFFSVVYSEIQRSCMSLTRPCFDVSLTGWVTQKFETVGGDAFRALLAELDIDNSPLEPCVLGMELAEIFGEVRTVRIVLQAYSNSPIYGAPTPLALYLPARVVLCLGKLVRYYRDHCQGRLFRNLLPKDLIHQAAVLGALYWVRKAGHIDSIKVSSTSTLYSAGPMILARMRDALSRFDDTASTTEEKLYLNLRFWVLYIGAQEEQGRVGRGEIVDKWFTARLVKASADINVFSWQQARPVLERYPHPDAAEPHGSTWFSSIFADASTGSTCLGGVSARVGTKPLKSKPLSNGCGVGDNYMTWTTGEPLGPNGDGNVTSTILAQSIAPTRPATFICPSWDVAQEAPLDINHQLPDRAKKGGYASYPNDPKPIGTESRPVTFARFSDRETAQYISTQEARSTQTACPSQHNDLVTGWTGEQQYRSSISPTPATDSLHHPSWNTHLSFQPSCLSPPFQNDISSSTASISTPIKNETAGYTSRMNDPKLTGVETGPVSFAQYPQRKVDETEAVAEARKHSTIAQTPPTPAYQSWGALPESHLFPLHHDGRPAMEALLMKEKIMEVNMKIP